MRGPAYQPSYKRDLTTSLPVIDLSDLFSVTASRKSISHDKLKTLCRYLLIENKTKTKMFCVNTSFCRFTLTGRGEGGQTDGANAQAQNQKISIRRKNIFFL